MAILRSCCCKYSIRKGCKASGIYTLIYFILFALLTGNYSYHEVVNRYFRQQPDQEIHLGGGKNETTTIGYLTTPKLTEQNSTNISSPLPTDIGQYGQSSSGDMALILVDFFCEISGIVASIFLLRGLHLEKKAYLVPWLVVVPLHTVIDACTVINIVIQYTATESKDIYSDFVTGMFILLDLILNLINVYIFLCVISQYQEYNAGRGTAAYEGFNWQEPGSVRYDGGNASLVCGSVSGATNGSGCGRKHRRLNGTNPCFSENEKSDIWCEDLVLDKLDSNSVELWPDESLTRRTSVQSGHKKRSRKTSNATVRFECEGEESITPQGVAATQLSPAGSGRKILISKVSPTTSTKYSAGDNGDLRDTNINVPVSILEP